MLRLKVEINSREHFAVYGFKRLPFSVHSRWFEGSGEITTYELEELLGTKLRALYQRRKARDLFDLHVALQERVLDVNRVIGAFLRYMAYGGHSVSGMHSKRTLRRNYGIHNSMLISARYWPPDTLGTTKKQPKTSAPN